MCPAHIPRAHSHSVHGPASESSTCAHPRTRLKGCWGLALPESCGCWARTPREGWKGTPARSPLSGDNSEVSSMLFSKVPSRIPLQVPTEGSLHQPPCFPSPPSTAASWAPAPINRALEFLSQGLLLGTPKPRKPCLGTKQMVATKLFPSPGF